MGEKRKADTPDEAVAAVDVPAPKASTGVSAGKASGEAAEIGRCAKVARIDGGQRARLKSDGRVGEIVRHDPEDSNGLNYKLLFVDGSQDWFAQNAVHVLHSFEEMEAKAERMRRDALEKLGRLKVEIVDDFHEYRSRLQLFTAAKSVEAGIKLLVGFLPGGHVASEAVGSGRLLSEAHQVVNDCMDLASAIANVTDLYGEHRSDVDSDGEAKLLTVLTRKTTLLGEKLVHEGGASTVWRKEGEPGRHVLGHLLAIRAQCERLRTLAELGLCLDGDAEAVPRAGRATAAATDTEPDDPHGHWHV